MCVSYLRFPCAYKPLCAIKHSSGRVSVREYEYAQVCISVCV